MVTNSARVTVRSGRNVPSGRPDTAPHIYQLFNGCFGPNWPFNVPVLPVFATAGTAGEDQRTQGQNSDKTDSTLIVNSDNPPLKNDFYYARPSCPNHATWYHRWIKNHLL